MSRAAVRPAEIAVVGPGAIGATIAAELSRAGRKVLLCGRTVRPAITVERAEVIRRVAGTHGVPTPISDVVVPLLAAASDGW